MPQISKITKQKKRERFNIFLDGRFAFSVSNYSLLENKLTVGCVLDEEKITLIIAKEQIGNLTDLAVKFLSIRPRSEKEIKDYLAKKIAIKNELKFSDAQTSPLVGQVIDKLKHYKYINDEEFATWLLNSRLKSTSPRSLRLIKAELKAKGISPEIVEIVSQNTPNESEQAKKALSKKTKRWQKLPGLEFKKKAYSYLLSRGYGFDSVRDAVAFYTKKR